jgi:TetR/AcrR family transcriptional repressor of nem operon
MTKKEQILCAAKCLMLEKGYVATTVDDICQAAEVTKGSFFHYFKDKEAMGREALTDFAQCTDDALCCVLPENEADPLKRVYNVVDAAIKLTKKKEINGCLVGMFSQELSQTHPAIRKICERLFDAQITSLEKDLAAAKTKYAPKSKFKPKDLSEYFLATVQGSMLVSKAKKDNSVMERSLKQYRNYLKTLYGK